MKWNIKKGDNVVVLTGDDKGKKGRVSEVIREKSRVIVEGVNINTKHSKPNAQNPQGGIVKTEAGIHISNVALVDAKPAATKEKKSAAAAPAPKKAAAKKAAAKKA